MTILVLTNSVESPLVEKILNMGYLPQLAENLDKVVDGLQHEDVSMVLVDTNHLGLDLLESLVTIHDETHHVPIYVWGHVDDGPVIDFVNKQNNISTIIELDEIDKIVT